MNNTTTYILLLKRFFDYYRLPLSIINNNGKTLCCFPQEDTGYILPPSVMVDELTHYMDSHIDYYTPFLINAPYDSFIAIIPLQENTFLFIGPSFSRPFLSSKIANYSKGPLKMRELFKLQEIANKLPLIDEAYLSDALSLLVLLLHHKDITPQSILEANGLSTNQKSVFKTSQIIESEYEKLLLFEAQVQSCIHSGQDTALAKIWAEFSVSVKEDFVEYMYTEHHFMIPLLSSARQAALDGGAPKEEVLLVFHSTISQISSRGSLSVNLKTIERATYALCNLVKKNKSVPFRTDICMKCELYIDEHLGEKITAVDIANYCGVDRSLIFDIFRKNYNMSLTDYIQEKKMHRAKIMLRHSALSISEIASTLGYCSSSYFSKIFYSHFNCKPTKYRSLNQ